MYKSNKLYEIYMTKTTKLLMSEIRNYVNGDRNKDSILSRCQNLQLGLWIQCNPTKISASCFVGIEKLIPKFI